LTVDPRFESNASRCGLATFIELPSFTALILVPLPGLSTPIHEGLRIAFFDFRTPKAHCRAGEGIAGCRRPRDFQGHSDDRFADG
jgi:hypothetical protein